MRCADHAVADEGDGAMPLHSSLDDIRQLLRRFLTAVLHATHSTAPQHSSTECEQSMERWRGGPCRLV